MDIKATAMKATPAKTSFPPLNNQTIKAIIAAGNMKNRSLVITTMIIIPRIRSRFKFVFAIWGKNQFYENDLKNDKIQKICIKTTN